jgi:hypothetical protein
MVKHGMVMSVIRRKSKMKYYKMVYVNKCLSYKRKFRSETVSKDLCEICTLRLENWIAKILREEMNR